ncbi:MAG: hypothetical protein E7501_06385 [Ruminococcus sp.]|nr:hypothetical protein [Ruminococcus sp.]
MHLFKLFHTLTASAVVLNLIAVVPAASVSAEIISQGFCGESIEWTLSDDGTLTLSGSGETYDYLSVSDHPWLTDAESVTAVTIGEGITVLGDYLFAELSALRTVDLPDGLTEIGASTFSRCAALGSIALPETLTTIQEYGFYQSGLTEVFLPDSLTEIGYEAFGACTQLTGFATAPTNPHYTTADGVLYTADMQTLVRYPIGLSEGVYTVPDVISIGAAAFSGTNFTDVTIPGTVREIGAYAFYGCYSLCSVHFGYGVKSIGNHAFRLCTSLYDVTLPNSLESIGVYAFRDCLSLTVLQLPFRLCEIYHESIQTDSLRTVYCFADSYSAYVAGYYGYDLRYLGDMNSDKSVNTNDAVSILKLYSQSLLGKPVTDSRVRRMADLNLSGSVDLLDAVAVLRYDSYTVLGQTPDWGVILP